MLFVSAQTISAFFEREAEDAAERDGEWEQSGCNDVNVSVTSRFTC